MSKVEDILGYFLFTHLPDSLWSVSQSFYTLAHEMDTVLPDSEEKYQALRKLLEAKDCAVRAALGE